MRKVLAALAAGSMLLVGVACDDNESGGQGGKIDEDDTNFGPGDGEDEFGPGR